VKVVKIAGGVALAAGMLLGGVAQAAVIGTLSFTTPTGTVTPTESIDVWVTLTLDESSDPLSYLPNDGFPSGVNPDDIPLEAYSFDVDDFVPFDSYNYVSAFTSRSCSDTFTVGCSDVGSEYGWSSANSDNWFDFEGTINPGESVDFKLYTLTPADGSATPGFYEAFNVGLGLSVYGEDADGNELEADIYQFYTDCGDASCDFSRTVVPIPAAAWLFGSAMVGLVGLARRRSGGRQAR
jgi:hypothetical protein